MAEQNEDLSLRESLENAFTADETGGQEEGVAKDVEPSPAPSTEPSAKTSDVEGGGEPTDKPGKTRDPSGKFVKGSQATDRPKGEATAPVKAVQTASEAKKPVDPNAQIPPERQPLSRAPGTWRPAAREKWNKLEPDVQQEILRREREITKGFTELQDARQFREEFARTLSPYQHIIASEGGHPLAVVNNLFATAAALSHGTPMQKVQTAASIIRNFGVDLKMLDEFLASNGGVAAAQQSSQVTAQQYIEQEVQKVLQPLLAARQQNMQKVEEDANQTIDQFSVDPQNEFFWDVKDDMADILEMAAKRGQKMDLSTAYNRAIMMNSELSEVVQQRSLQQAATKSSTAAKAARSKAVSVTGAPASPANAADRSGSLRDDILNSIDNLS